MKAPPSLYRRNVTGFVPVSEEARAFFGKCKIGETIALDGRKPRSVRWHRLFFALLNVVVENSDDWETPEQLLYAVKATMGRGRWIAVSGATRELFIPDSISFAKMTADEWDRFWTEALRVIAKHFLKGVRADDLRTEIEAMIDGDMLAADRKAA